MNRFTQARLVVLIILAPLILLGCTDSPLDPTVPDGQAHLQFRADLASTAVSTLVVEVTARGIPAPLIFNIEVRDGIGAGQVTVPAGSERTVTVRAYDSGGVETHRGSTTLNVREGTNPTVSIVLTPLMGTQPVSASIGSTVIGLSPGVATLEVGDTVRLQATIFGADGDSTAGKVSWATVNPARASVDSAGLVTALTPGSVQIVGTFGGAGGAATINISGDSVGGGGGGTPGGDITPPTLNSFSFTPDSVDVSDGSATVSATLTVADAVSGVDYVSAHFRSPSGRQGHYCYGQLYRGSVASGTWTCEMNIPKFSEAGDWEVSSVSLGDAIGNHRTLYADDLRDAGYATDLLVLSLNADSTAPTLTDFSFFPDLVDVSEGMASVSVSFTVADAVSGVNHVSASFHSPSWQQSRYCSARLSSGTVTNGIWTCEISIPQHSEAGYWEVDSISLSDVIGNHRTLYQDDLRDGGYEKGLMVVSLDADSIAPTLSDFSLTPDSVDVNAGSATVNLRFTVADAVSGVNNVYAALRSPTWGEWRWCYAQLSTGTIASGIWTCEMSIPWDGEAGNWEVDSISLTDVIGNQRTLHQDDLQEAGFNTRLVVVSR